MKKTVKIVLWITIITCLFSTFVVAANVIGNVTDTGMGFSTNVGEKTYQWYENGTTVSTGNTIPQREELKKGQHYYSDTMIEYATIPISRWEVRWKNMACIHGERYDKNSFAGFSCTPHQFCYSKLYSGWIGYCRDCDEPVSKFLDMSMEVAQSISSVKNRYKYAYVCPHCNGLNTAITLSHGCKKEVSDNKYRVAYRGNGAVSGFTNMTNHMYNNSELYQGKKISPDTKLSTSYFKRPGYMFAGWNTKPDGTGISYKNNAEVLNLTEINEATVNLYAQWKPIDHFLDINPNGGEYNNEKDITSIYKQYGSVYSMGQITKTPYGHTVSFDTNNGKLINPIITETEFTEWEFSGHHAESIIMDGFKGGFDNEYKYHFFG